MSRNELPRLRSETLARFEALSERIAPLIGIQTSDRTRKLVAARIELYKPETGRSARPVRTIASARRTKPLYLIGTCRAW